MKHFYVSCFLFFLCSTIADAQNYMNIPGPENVLVVYDSLDQTSIDIKDYYQNARNIPSTNVVALTNLVNDDIYDPISQTYHQIEIHQDGEIIADQQLSYNPINRHSWRYFIERIAEPIAYHLRTTIVNGEPLTNTIKFIVLCKGVPFRILTTPDHGGSCNHNVPVDALLCFLGEDINDPYHLMSYLNEEGVVGGNCVGTFTIENPYYNADPDFTMSHNFKPNFYSKHNSHFNRDITLSYLITHLDGMSLIDVKNMIDSSIAAINSSGYDWFIDADPTPCLGGSEILKQTTTENIFNDLGVNNKFIKTDEDIYTSHNKPVMSYSSNGRHTTYGSNNSDACSLYFNPDYVQTQLNFIYIAGSVFNTGESFNVNTLGTDPPVRRVGAEQGQIPEFFRKGGTVGVGQVNHGSNGSIIIQNDIMLPSYLLGYTFIEAAYLGMTNLTDNRIVLGDPLTRIYNYQIDTLSSNIVLSATTIKHKIVVPAGITLTLAGTVSFERNAQLIVQGGLVIQDNSIIDFGSLSYLETENIVIGSGVSLTFKSKSRFEINNSISVGTNSHLTIKENATGTVPSMEIMGGTYFSIMDNGTLNVAGNVVVHTGSTLSLGGSCRINSNTGLFMPGSLCNLSGNAVLNFKNLTVNPGCSLTVANNSKLETTDKFISIANENSKIYYLSAGSGAVNASGTDSLIFTYSEFNGARLSVANNQTMNNPAKPVEVSNCNFSNGNAGLELWSTTAPSKRIDISNCTFTNLNTSAILLGNNCYAEIEDVTITGTVNSEQQNAIIVESVYDVIINELTITDYGYGVTTARREGLTEILSVSLFTLENSVISCEYPVLLNSQEASLGSITLFNLILSNGSGAGGTAITINGADRGQLRIGNNSCSGFEYGIQITNSNNFSLTKNTVTNCFNGIQLNNVNNYFLIKNNLTGTSSSVGIGVDNFSGNGLLRNNTITNYQTGILSNNSTSDIGMYGNNITQNKLGVWLYDGKIDMSRSFLTLAANNFYSNLYGYNIIKENGTENCATEREEIKIENGQLLIEDGCNEITDDRHDGLSCGHEILIDGKTGEYQINGVGNYWGTRSYHGHDPIGRFGAEIQLDYIPFLSEPCIPLEGQATQLFLTGSNTVIDTIIISPVNGSNLTGEELLAALADGAMLQSLYNDAKNYYHQLLNLNADDQQSYIQLFQIEKMLGGTNDDFRILREYYESKLNSITENEVREVVDQLINFCYVAEEDYETALDNYNELVANYPATYRAYCAELNILSTSLLIGNSGLQKAGKYKGVSLAEYRNKLNEIKAKYGFIKINETDNLPKEYALAQNFPNPFNPVTTIRYEIPKSGRVSLKIYDILGRTVTTLVNEEKEVGRYTVNFDASKLSSGVYLYELVVNDYRAVKKLMVIK